MNKLCENCKKEQTKRRFCSRFCQIQYYNSHSPSQPITKTDSMGRTYLSCSKCGNRLKMIEGIGRTKFTCTACIKASNHLPNQNSVFMKRIFKKDNKTKELLLEITQNNRNWHYINGRSIQGFKQALKSFRARAHILVHRENFTEIC